MQDFVTRPNTIPRKIEPGDFRKSCYRTTRYNCRIELVTPPLAHDFVIAQERSFRVDDLKAVTRQSANLLTAVFAKTRNLLVFPVDDLSEVSIGMQRLNFEPAASPGMMHLIDRLEERLRGHAPGINTERGMIALIAHKKEDVRALLTCDSRASKPSRAAAD